MSKMQAEREAPNFVLKDFNGKEISLPGYPSEFPDEIIRFLQANIQDAKYTAVFKSGHIPEKNRWIPLLNSKFGDCVGGVILSKDSKGCILILPQISRKDQAIVALLSKVLPAISPHLFPHVEGAKWVERDEYELDSDMIFLREDNKIETSWYIADVLKDVFFDRFEIEDIEIIYEYPTFGRITIAKTSLRELELIEQLADENQED